MPKSERRGAHLEPPVVRCRVPLGEELGSKVGCAWVASRCRDLQPSATGNGLNRPGFPEGNYLAARPPAGPRAAVMYLLGSI